MNNEEDFYVWISSFEGKYDNYLFNSKGPDASTSITTEQFKELISQIRIIEKMKFKKL